MVVLSSWFNKSLIAEKRLLYITIYLHDIAFYVSLTFQVFKGQINPLPHMKILQQTTLNIVKRKREFVKILLLQYVEKSPIAAVTESICMRQMAKNL